jgi:hypothetical protein
LNVFILLVYATDRPKVPELTKFLLRFSSIISL